MLYTGKLLYAELYDDSTYPYTGVRAVWEANRDKHPGHCIVVNAHWHDPGPSYIGNYKIDGKVLSEDYPQGQWGFGWNSGAPKMRFGMDDVDNFVSTIPALIDGERQWLDYGGGVTRSTTRTWLGVDGEGNWTVEVTTSNYTLVGIVERMKSLGIVDGMVFDGSGSSQWYDGETHVKGDGRTVYSYLILWFEDAAQGGDDNMDVKTGVDVSKWQGEIDWEKAKADGVEFAMIRAGYGQGNIDDRFKRNADECTRLGIPFGVYWFSYAYTEDMARKEAQYCLNAVAPYKLSYPIAFDFEYDSVDHAQGKGVIVTKTLASAIARAFLTEIENAGYYATLYANPNYLATYFDDNIPTRYDIWLAQWPRNPQPEPKPEQCGGMWQYTSSGTVDGIEGRVDMNYAYYDYPTLTGNIPEPEEPEQEEEPMTWEEEQKGATEWVVAEGLSDGERPNDGVKRIEFWVTLWRFYKLILKLFGKE